MTDAYVARGKAFLYVPAVQSRSVYRPQKKGGYFSSTYPDFIVTREGVPSPGEIRVLMRSDKNGDGALIAKTMADNTGQWRIDGLDPDFRYDVVCRIEGYNDIIFSNVKPKV